MQVKGIDRNIVPLYQRYICWKYGIRPGGSIWNIELCPYLVEMAEIMASAKKKNMKDYLNVSVFFISPLKFSREEADQFMWFVEKGYSVGISHMSSLGGSAPVTLAGAVSLHLAESFFINIIKRAFFNERMLQFGCSISNMDMSSGAFMYGRPEKSLANVVMAQMSRFYKGRFIPQAGQCDAKMPSYESGVQKALLAIPAIIYGGGSTINAGLLSIDEICSPIQMVFDNELIGALRRFVKGCSFEEDDFAIDLIKKIKYNGAYIDKEHTVRHFKNVLWEPNIWSKELLSSWLSGDMKSDMDKAKDICSSIESDQDLPLNISAETELRLKKVIEKAKRIAK